MKYLLLLCSLFLFGCNKQKMEEDAIADTEKLIEDEIKDVLS